MVGPEPPVILSEAGRSEGFSAKTTTLPWGIVPMLTGTADRVIVGKNPEPRRDNARCLQRPAWMAG